MILCGYNKEYIILFFSGAFPGGGNGAQGWAGIREVLPVLPTAARFVSPPRVCLSVSYPFAWYPFAWPIPFSVRGGLFPAAWIQSHQTHASQRSSYCTIILLCARCICLCFYHFPLDFIMCAWYNKRRKQERKTCKERKIKNEQNNALYWTE